jgi:DNA-directed RNA polymerase subunit alpha
VDLVRIDAIYNPVRRANFEVRETRVGQRTDFDRLTLEVETDGSVSPADAVAVAAELVKRHMDYLLHFRVGGIKAAPEGGHRCPSG